MIITDHAKYRFNERFPGLDIEETFFLARYRIGRKRMRIIKNKCPAHAKFCCRMFKGIYYTRTKDDIIFVVEPPEKIITVFKIET